jgi:soluble lytic murein transglycosylase-like protein
VAEEFESLFVSMLLRSMRRTVGDEGFPPQSLGEKMYTEMLDDQYAGTIASNAGLGLADLIVKELDGGNGLQALRSLAAQGAQGGGDPPALDPTSLRQRISQWDSLIAEASRRYGIDGDLIASVIAQESGGARYAVSRAGAKGLMQLLDSTAADMGVQGVFDPRENIMGGARYLRMMLDRYGGDEKLALASYNAGPAAVDKYKGIPPYRETQQYVAGVQRLREAFAQIRSEQEQGG